MEQFIIPLSGLKPGIHTYTFHLDNEFFKHIDHSLIESGTLTSKLVLDKRHDMLVLNFETKGTIKVPCDRCTEEFDLKVAGKDQIMVKFSDEELEDEADLLYLPTESTQFDVANLVYEMVIINVPMRKVHPSKKGKPGCDPEIMKFFVEAPEEIEEEETPANPIWDVLKQIKDQTKD
jgi:uncharacterized metal-binding protein YceD (DUF177 family)